MGDGLLMDLGRPGIGHSRDLSLLHLTLQVCSDWSWQQSTGQAHTHSLSLCWSPLVTTGHHSGLMGDGLLMDLGRPGIGHSRDLSLLHLTLQVCSDWSWQQSTGQLTAHHSLSLCWSQHSMDLGWSVELGTLGWSVELGTPWTWAGLWNWELHGPGLVCGIGHSMDLGWSVELGTLWTWAVFTLAPLELGAPWAWGLWSLWIWDTPRTWGLPVPPNSLSLCCTECLFPPLWHSGRESINTNGGPDDGKWINTPLFPRDGLPCIPRSSSRSLGSEIIL